MSAAMGVDEAWRGLIVAVWAAPLKGLLADGPRDGSGPLFPFLKALWTVFGVQQERSAGGAPAELTDQQGRGATTKQRMRLAAPLRPVAVQGWVVR